MTRYVIDTEIREWVTRDRDPNDEWDIGDVTGVIDNVHLRQARDWEVEGKHYSRLEGSSYMLPEGHEGEVHAIVACVEDGCSFGRTGVSAYIMGVYPSCLEASTALDEMRKPGGDVYYPWSGYFESLESLEVYSLGLTKA